MSRAVHEPLPISAVANDRAGGVVQVGAGDPRFPPAGAQQVHGRIARPAHGVPHPLDFRVRRGPGEPHPRLVGEDTAFRRAGPQVQEDHVAGLEPAVGTDARLVMRVSRIRLKADNGRVVGHEPRPREAVEHPPLHRRLAHLGAPRHFAARPADRLRGDRRERLSGAAVAVELGRAPARGEISIATVLPPTRRASSACSSGQAAYGRTSPGNPPFPKGPSSILCATATGAPARGSHTNSRRVARPWPRPSTWPTTGLMPWKSNNSQPSAPSSARRARSAAKSKAAREWGWPSGRVTCTARAAN